jgi:flagellar biosynthesis/type III secretory pathway chaperone
MSIDEQMNMLDELQGLLEMQLKLAHRGNSAGKQIEILGKQADSLVEKIAQAGILNRPEFKSQKEKLKKSYEDLRLAITAQRTDTVEKLSQVRRGRKIVETYRNNS